MNFFLKKKKKRKEKKFKIYKKKKKKPLLTLAMVNSGSTRDAFTQKVAATGLPGSYCRGGIPWSWLPMPACRTVPFAR